MCSYPRKYNLLRIAYLPLSALLLTPPPPGEITSFFAFYTSLTARRNLKDFA